MKDLAKTYLKYGVPSDWAEKYDKLALAASVFRALPLATLKSSYAVPEHEARLVKDYLKRRPIDDAVMTDLLTNSNFTCCCCQGVKSDGYIVHHIVKYEVSQDNSYANLAVLCPNDHDLAHRQTGLVSGIGEDAIRAAKLKWEQSVQLHRLAAASPVELNKFYLKIPRYQAMQDEMDELRRSLRDREAIAGLQAENGTLRLGLLQQEKDALEAQVRLLADKLSRLQPEDQSALHAEVRARFLAGDIAGVLEALSEKELDAQMDTLLRAHERALKGLRQNIDDRMLRATLLLLNGKVREACDLAGQTLEKCENLGDKFPEFQARLVECFEEVGTIYFNAGHVDAAEAVFKAGLELGWTLQEQGENAVVPFIPDFLHNLGTICYAREDYEAAKDHLENSAEWYRGLRPVYENRPQLPHNPIDDKLVKNLTNLATTYNALKMTEQAVALYDQIEQMSEPASAPSSQEGDLRIRFLSSKANMLLSSGDALGASSLFEELIPLLEKSAADYPSMYARELTNTCLELCAAVSMLGAPPDKAAECCGRALQAARRMVAADPAGDPGPLAYALMYHGLHLLQTGAGDECAAAVEEAKAIVDALPPDRHDPQLHAGLEALAQAAAR